MLTVLEEMMSPAYYAYFAKILNVDMFGGLTGADVAQIINDLPANTKGGEIAQRAIARVGTPYSQLDCSKLVQTVYGEVGIYLPRTSVEQAKYCYNNGYTIAASQLQAGDLIFWSKPGCSCGRWNEIHHVGIYIGNGQIVDASSSKGRVVLRNVWQGSGFVIYMYARP
ncbi:C40 family peptidase [Christensenellaceae bacterium OttesenSCG-928-L17]|nr:C40 family peptidase [Christensenellaceae bacterium OttesenSCG-928-L17]